MICSRLISRCPIFPSFSGVLYILFLGDPVMIWTNGPASSGSGPHPEKADVLGLQEGPRTRSRHQPWSKSGAFLLWERKLGATLCKNESKTGMTCQNDGLMWMVVKHRTSLILKYHKRPTTWIPKWTRQTTWTPKMKKSSTKLLYQDFPRWFVTLTWISCSNSHWRALARPKSTDAHVLQPRPNSQQIPAFLCRSISPAVKIEKNNSGWTILKCKICFRTVLYKNRAPSPMGH